jgi:hypothetical protein
LGPVDWSRRRPGSDGGRVFHFCSCGPLQRHLHNRWRHPHLRQGRTIIDHRENRVVRWQGLLVPLRRTVRPLDSFDGVRLDCSREGETKSYPVHLTKGGKPAGAITVEEPADYQRARQTVKTLARFVRKPLEDRSSGEKRLAPSPGITARSDRTAITIGKGLSDDELAYLYALIRKILTD